MPNHVKQVAPFALIHCWAACFRTSTEINQASVITVNAVLKATNINPSSVLKDPYFNPY